jgi:RNA polymerase sigma-70 factor (ECF subfamily)
MPLSEQSLIRLHTEHALTAFRFAWSVTRDESLAQDVVQELFVRLAIGTVVLEKVRSERAVILRVVRNLALDILRRARTRASTAQRWSSAMPEWFEPVFGIEEEETQQRLTAALADLPEDQRSVIHLHVWEDLSFREIAELLDVPMQTIASRYRYGLEKLRAALTHLQTVLL